MQDFIGKPSASCLPDQAQAWPGGQLSYDPMTDMSTLNPLIDMTHTCVVQKRTWRITPPPPRVTIYYKSVSLLHF